VAVAPDSPSRAVGAPRLSFACELDAERLTRLFAGDALIDELTDLRARVLMMVSDHDPRRAEVVQRLNRAGVPVVGIPLFPVEEGYYFTADNSPHAEDRYEQWKAWSQQHGLVWDGVGLDIEPEARFYQQIIDDPRGLPRLLAPRLLDRERPRRARADYQALIDRIRRDGWSVENYQFPLLAEERRAGSTLLQRLLGLVDVRTDREVWMLYTSVFPGSLGPALLWSYGPEAQAIAVGTTGGGPDLPGHPQLPYLSWEQFARDLRLARHWSDAIVVHSLEGCVWHGYLSRLRAFDWSSPQPPRQLALVRCLRIALRATLWASAHPLPLLTGALTLIAARRAARMSGHAVLSLRFR
jgi:hypothetical protein